MILLYLFGTFLYDFNSTIIKTINISLLHKLLISVAISVALSILSIKLIKPEFSLKLNTQSLWVSLLYFIQTVLLFVSFLILPISVALPLNFGGAIISVDIFNKLINNINGNFSQWISNIIIIIGLITACYSKTNTNYKYFSIGIILCFVWAIIDGYNMVSIRNNKTEDNIHKKDNDSINLSKELFESNVKIYKLSIVSFIILSFVMIIIKIFNIKKIPLLFNNKSNINDLLKFSGYQIILSYIGFLLIYISLDNLNISIWGSFYAVNVIFSLIIGKTLLNEKIGTRKTIGCLLIIGGIIYKSLNTKD